MTTYELAPLQPPRQSRQGFLVQETYYMNCTPRMEFAQELVNMQVKRLVVGGSWREDWWEVQKVLVDAGIEIEFYSMNES